MLEQVKGKLVEKTANYLLVEAGPVILKVLASRQLVNILPEKNEDVQIITYLQIKEDEWSLFGFASQEEREFFEDLLKVAGVGPKVALKILSLGAPEELQRAVAKKQEEIFTQAPGVGKKLAQKIILELQAKYKDAAGIGPKAGVIAEFSSQELEALESLGYTRRQAQEALRQLNKSVQGLENRVREALRLLAK